MIKRSVWSLVAVVAMVSSSAFGEQVEIPFLEGGITRLGLGDVYEIAYSRDGELMAIAATRGVELRDSETVELIEIRTGHTGRFYSVAFAYSGMALGPFSLLLIGRQGFPLEVQDQVINFDDTMV